MVDMMRRALSPPQFGDEDRDRRARLLHFILLFLLMFTSILGVFYKLLVPENIAGRWLVFLGIAVELFTYALLRFGNVRLSGIILVTLLWSILMVTILYYDGVRGTAILGQVLLIFVGGLLISEAFGLSLGLLTLGGSYTAMLLETNGLLPLEPVELPLSAHWVFQSIYVVLAFGLMAALRRSVRDELHHAQLNEQALKDKVVELRQAQAQLEMSGQDLRRREAILETVRSAAEKLFRGHPFAEAAQEVLKDIGFSAGVDRVYIFQNIPDADLKASRRYEWVAPGIQPQMQNPNLQSLTYSHGFARWANELSQGNAIKGSVADFPESERELLASQGIGSLFAAPIFVGEKWWGFIGFDETKRARAWSPAEEEALRGAAGILGGALERLRAEQALNESEQRYLGILQDQFDLICRYKPNGEITFANEAYQRYFGIDAEKAPRLSLWDNVLEKDREKVRAKIASLRPAQPVTISQQQNKRHDGSLRWVEWTDRGIFSERKELVEIQAVGRDIDEEVRLRKQLEENLVKMETQAMTDPLTGLLNRRAIMEHAEAEWQRSQRETRPLSLLLIDVDHLKELNDSYGHFAGDLALTHLAELMRAGMRRYDWLGRWGGDEFLLILPGTELDEARMIAERLRTRVQQNKLMIEGRPIGLRMSLGVAAMDFSEGAGDSLEQLLARADRALYSAKQAGRDKVGFARQT
jgi:diguanylate cyclase (GGDEF)-like protein/PAS domain S-box-containing protein